MAFTKYKPEGPRKANFLGGGKEAPKNENWHESPKVEAQEGSETQEEKVAMTHGPLPLKGIYSAMSMGVFQKGGLSEKNSDRYNAVVTDLARVIGSWSASLSGNMEEMQKTFSNTEYFYGELISSCKKYLKRRSFSSQGKARQEIVRNILEQAEIDKHSLKEYFLKHQSLSESERASNVQDALAIARRKVLIMGKADSEYKHVGGDASRLTVFEDGDLEGNASGFFKDEDIYTNYGERQQLALPEILEHARKLSPISDELYKKVCKYVNEKYICSEDKMEIRGDVFEDIKGLSDSPEYSAFYDIFNGLCEMFNSTFMLVHKGGYSDLDLEEGEKANITNRNVASSRMAEALGVGNLIAKSETVEVREPGQKKGRVGNLMQKANGKAATKYREQYIGEAKTTEEIKVAIDEMAKKITGNFQKELASLQVLDYLTGQTDRHLNNYFIQKNEKGELDSLTGIDNDMSFGTIKLDAMFGTSAGAFTAGRHGRSPVDAEGNFILPHMDKAFAERILAFTDDQITFLLGDLIEEKNIKHACERLHTLQKAIREKQEEDREKEGSEKTFLTDEQWNEKTLEDSKNMSDRQGTYLGRLFKFKS